MDFQEAERTRHFQLNLLIGLAGFAFLLAFGINAWLQEQAFLAASLLLTAAFGLFFLFLMWLRGEPRYGGIGVSMSAAYLFLFLIVTGGIDGTGPLWCYPLLAIIVFLQGLTRGLFVIGALWVITAALMYVPDLPIPVTDYSDSFKSRFLFSFVALAIMALTYEHLRGASQIGYQELSDQLDRASRTDDLTGLANRREMRQRLDDEQGIYRRYGHAYSAIMIDLDHFKRVNDRFGHAEGDRLLVMVARCLRANVRQQDHVGRWGGEEFLVLLPQTRLAQARQVAEKLRHAVSNLGPVQDAGGESITASFGVQSIDNAKDVEDLVRQADGFMYEAKRQGRDCVLGDLLSST